MKPFSVRVVVLLVLTGVGAGWSFESRAAVRGEKTAQNQQTQPAQQGQSTTATIPTVASVPGQPAPPAQSALADPPPHAAQTGHPHGAEALKLFGSLEDDRALVYVGSGPPDGRTTIHCPELFRTLEVWTYLDHSKLGKNASMIFFPESGTTSYRYWTVLEGEAALIANSPKAPGKPLQEVDAEKTGCPEATLVLNSFKEIGKRQTDNTGGLKERASVAVEHVLPPTTKHGPAPVPQLVSNKPLSGKERRKLLEALPDRFRSFLQDVEPIIADLERDTFLRIGSDYQRDRFIEGFWKRRSLDADGMRVPFRDIYEYRLQLAKQKYRGINSDQGRIFLINGPPDGLRRIECDDIYWPLEIWFYERLESLKMSKVPLLFYEPYGAGDFRLWTPLDGPQAILAGGMAGLGGASAPMRRMDITRCPEWREINAALNTMQVLFGTSESMQITNNLKEGPKPDVEGVDQILLMTTDITAGATKLPLQRVVRFPEMVANKVRLELAMMLERESLAKKVIGDETFFDIDVVGEIVKGSRLVDNFRYRFDFPISGVSGPFVPVTIERDLYPGDYQIKVKVADANQNAAGIIEEKLKVPETADSTLTAEEKAAREAAKATMTRLVANPGAQGSLAFLPLAREICTGLIRFETRVTSNDIAFTEFYLDNQRIFTKHRPPFAADLDLGSLPRKHTVKVIGYTKEGRTLGEDEMILNEGREAFRVRIVSPDKGAPIQGPTRVVADLAVPESKKLKQVEFYVNESRAAVLYQPPFQQVVDVPKSKDLGFVRVVATLEDGSVVEDLRYFNAPKYLSEVNVQAVELYTSVISHGKPVTGLTKENFTVVEDAVPQSIDGFEIVTNLPLSLGIGVDTSGSMEESIVEAQKAASEFLKDVMTPRDRCFLVTFDNEPQLVAHFTPDRDRIAQALAGIRAQGSTALWDAIVYGLYQYQGTKGRKAYVLLTDGEDRASRFTFEATLDYAKKAGVAIYFIGLRIGGAHLDVRYKLNKMAKETGGAVYYIDSAHNLGGIYKEIDEELRSQYLISYLPSSSSTSNHWRKIEVKMKPDNLTARTISGYYP